MANNNNLNISVDSGQQFGAVIKVVGAGGGGSNAINRMIEEGVTGVEFIVANTDVQVLESSKAETKLQLGPKLTKGLGAGSNPEVGEEAALESEQNIADALRGADMIFIATGMGGGTGTGSAPIIAQIARDQGALTIGVVTRPFTFEGPKRARYAAEWIARLKDNVDALVVVSNNRLLELLDRKAPMTEAFKAADFVLVQGVRGISDLITNPGIINLDFADVKTVMTNSGSALLGVGVASGENRAVEATKQAIASPLLEVEITGAHDVLFNITGGSDMSLYEAQSAVEVIQQTAGKDVNVVFGTAIDGKMNDEVRVTVIAVGLDASGNNSSIKDMTTNRNIFDEDAAAANPTANKFENFSADNQANPNDIFDTAGNDNNQDISKPEANNNSSTNEDDLFGDWGFDTQPNANAGQTPAANNSSPFDQPIPNSQNDIFAAPQQPSSNDSQPFDFNTPNSAQLGSEPGQAFDLNPIASQTNGNGNPNDDRSRPPFFKKR